MGRTGTLVAIDSLLQEMDEQGEVTIFNTICDLRHQRNYMVQSLVSEGAGRRPPSCGVAAVAKSDVLGDMARFNYITGSQ